MQRVVRQFFNFRRYFFSLALSCKLNMRQECNINSSTLYERALAENIEWGDWPEWIPGLLRIVFLPYIDNQRL
jgi:hypothetical protein